MKMSQSKVNFGVNDAPLWVYQGISIPAKERYNDMRWVRLAELLQKEQELETLRLQIYGGVPEPSAPIAEEPKVDAPKVVSNKYLGKGN
jgi:hypothetical protein